MKRVISIAKKEIGYTEKGQNITKFSAFFEGSKFYNGSKGDGKTWGAEWCDIFVDWCFCQAYGMDTARKMLYQPEKSTGAGCKFSAGFYRASKAFFKTDPQPGDQIFFGKNGEESHTGIVEKVENGYVYTIEGNSENCVKENKYSLKYSRISGYGRPNWKLTPNDGEETEAGSKPTSKPVQTKTSDEIAREVIAGKWGNGKTRQQKLTAAGYDFEQIQAKVNELLKQNKPVSAPVPAVKQYRVIAKSGLNQRLGPSISAGYAGNAYPYGAVLNVETITNGWAKLSGRTAYVSAAYIKAI